MTLNHWRVTVWHPKVYINVYLYLYIICLSVGMNLGVCCRWLKMFCLSMRRDCNSIWALSPNVFMNSNILSTLNTNSPLSTPTLFLNFSRWPKTKPEKFKLLCYKQSQSTVWQRRSIIIKFIMIDTSISFSLMVPYLQLPQEVCLGLRPHHTFTRIYNSVITTTWFMRALTDNTR